jgi:hypothetical protein
VKRACAALALLVAAGGAAAQYPERPIRRRDSAKGADVLRRSGARID